MNQLLLHPLNGLFSRTTWVSQYQKGKTSLDLNEARDDRVLGCSGISWTICKQCAPHSRQITTPTHHHSIFTGRMLFLTPNQECQSTEGITLYYIQTWNTINGVISICTENSFIDCLSVTWQSNFFKHFYKKCTLNYHQYYHFDNEDGNFGSCWCFTTKSTNIFVLMNQTLQKKCCKTV